MQRKKILIGVIGFSTIFVLAITIFIMNNDDELLLQDQIRNKSVKIADTQNKKESFREIQEAEKKDNTKKQMVAKTERQITIIYEDEKQAQNNNEKYRYEDDIEFDLVMLSGKVEKYNREYRDEFYSRKDYELIHNQIENSNEDDMEYENAVEHVVDQFENVIDYALGVDFSEDKRKNIRNIQQQMLIKSSALDNLLEDNTITQEIYTSQTSKYYEKSLKNAAEILTDEEFEALFQLKKEEIDGHFSKLTSMQDAIEEN